MALFSKSTLSEQKDKVKDKEVSYGTRAGQKDLLPGMVNRDTFSIIRSGFDIAWTVCKSVCIDSFSENILTLT